MDALEDEHRPMTNYEKSKLKTAKLREEYGDCPELWPEGIRPADEAKEQQLIGGDDDFTYEQPGYGFTSMAQHFTSAVGFRGGPNNTDDAIPVNDNLGLMMPKTPIQKSNSQTRLTEYYSTNVKAT